MGALRSLPLGSACPRAIKLCLWKLQRQITEDLATSFLSVPCTLLCPLPKTQRNHPDHRPSLFSTSPSSLLCELFLRQDLSSESGSPPTDIWQVINPWASRRKERGSWPPKQNLERFSMSPPIHSPTRLCCDGPVFLGSVDSLQLSTNMACMPDTWVGTGSTQHGQPSLSAVLC